MPGYDEFARRDDRNARQVPRLRDADNCPATSPDDSPARATGKNQRTDIKLLPATNQSQCGIRLGRSLHRIAGLPYALVSDNDPTNYRAWYSRTDMCSPVLRRHTPTPASETRTAHHGRLLVGNCTLLHYILWSRNYRDTNPDAPGAGCKTDASDSHTGAIACTDAHTDSNTSPKRYSPAWNGSRVVKSLP
jgi:hypothetical protein